MYNGILNIYKPKGLTSHDVVYKVRKIAGMKKVGHTGTLDPMAEGVLPICLGKGTRIAEYLTGEDKVYLAEITFGTETDTLDAEGEVTGVCPVPDLSELELKNILGSFLGKSMQKPPVYSAIKKDGKPLYKYAREGKKPEVPEREIEIKKISLVSCSRDKLRFVVECSKGTYVRSLASDFAKKAGSCGHLSYLQRIKSGIFNIEESVSLEELEAMGVNAYLKDIDDCLPEFFLIKLDEEQSRKASFGNQLFIEDLKDKSYKNVKIRDYKGELIGIGSLESGVLRPQKVLI